MPRGRKNTRSRRRLVRRQALVGQKIVFEAFKNTFGKLGYLAVLFEDLVAFENSDQFIVSLAIVDQAEPADRKGPQDDVAARNVMFRKYEDVERIAVASADLDRCLRSCEIGDPLRQYVCGIKP